MWVTADPLNEKEAEEVMGKAVPDFDRYLKRGQIEILPYSEWYLKDGVFDLQRVLNAWVDKLNHALTKGYAGMRITDNTAWLEERDWRRFTHYEEAINNLIGEYQMMAICSYSLDKCGASEVIDVVSNHKLALIRNRGKWQDIENTEHKRVKEVLKESDEKYRFLFQNMLNGFAYCKILVDENDKPIDFVYLEVNDAFERLTGLRREDVIGRKVTEAIPGIKQLHPELFSIYGKVALTGEETKFDVYFEPLGIWLTISVYSPKRGYFSAVFENITEHKRAEEALHDNFNYGSIACMVGSWDRGTVSTISLGHSSLADLMDKLRNMPDVKKVNEEATAKDVFPTYLEKFGVPPRLNVSHGKRIQVTLKETSMTGQKLMSVLA